MNDLATTIWFLSVVVMALSIICITIDALLEKLLRHMVVGFDPTDCPAFKNKCCNYPGGMLCGTNVCTILQKYREDKK